MKMKRNVYHLTKRGNKKCTKIRGGIKLEGSINFDGLIREVGKCCLTEDECTKCDNEECLIGYSKKVLVSSLKKQDAFIDNGCEKIPYHDTKIYDDHVVTDTMGFLLNQCKNCNLYHDEDCIINIIRNSLEVILMGEAQEYKGSTFVYFNDIKNINKEVAQKIYTAFNERKSRG